MMRLKQKFMFKKIVVASDSFKGSLTSLQVADAVYQVTPADMHLQETMKQDVASANETPT